MRTFIIVKFEVVNVESQVTFFIFGPTRIFFRIEWRIRKFLLSLEKVSWTDYNKYLRFLNHLSLRECTKKISISTGLFMSSLITTWFFIILVWEPNLTLSVSKISRITKLQTIFFKETVTTGYRYIRKIYIFRSKRLHRKIVLNLGLEVKRDFLVYLFSHSRVRKGRRKRYVTTRVGVSWESSRTDNSEKKTHFDECQIFEHSQLTHHTCVRYKYGIIKR